MRVGLVSDTHGSEELIFLVIKQLASFNLDRVIHLGDNYEDGDHFIDAGFSLFRIPGTWSSYYQDPYIDNRTFLNLESWRFFLTHTPTKDYHDLPRDVDPETILNRKQCDVFCHGHTHHPRLEVVNGVLVINPGHLNKGDRRGYLPTYAILNLTDKRMEVCIYQLLDQTVLLQGSFEKDDQGFLVSV